MVFSLFKPKQKPVDLGPILHRAPVEQPVPPEIAGLSRKELVARAFDEMPLDERETEAVCALLDEPGSTCVELSRACGWMDSSWRTQMILLCQRRRKYLWPEGMAADVSNGIIISALAEYDTYDSTFTPRRDIVKSLRRAVEKAL